MSEPVFGNENKLLEEVELKAYFNLKRLNIDETNSNLSLYFDQRSYYYKDPKLSITIFNSISDDFSEQIGSINKKIKDAMDFQAFVDNGLAKKNDLIKILATGKISVPLKISAHKFSAAAKLAIEKSGGEAIIL